MKFRDQKLYSRAVMRPAYKFDLFSIQTLFFIAF